MPSTTITIKQAETDNFTAASATLTVTATAAEVTGAAPALVVNTLTGSTVTASRDGYSYSLVETPAGSGTYRATVPAPGTYTVTAVRGDLTATQTVVVGETHAAVAYTPHVYGVTWDGGSSGTFTRTDNAAEFGSATPYEPDVAGYSPFDNIYPWSGMVRVTDDKAGELVAIPRFWYKLEQNSDDTGDGITLRIADAPLAGYHVSPAHADRGDGKGERDVVYIGRYHCAANTYKSTSGALPQANITRATARDGIHALGDTIWQSDLLMRETIWMLYLVEMANWNSQSTIGTGCGNNANTENMGYTDSMPYHTGTTVYSGDYGLGTQYRYIEGLWDNVFDWLDGSYNASGGLYAIANPANFASGDNQTGGMLIGLPAASGYISEFAVKDSAYGIPLLFPWRSRGSSSIYIGDQWYYNADSPCLYVGGCFNRGRNNGLFCAYCDAASGREADVGARLQKLP